MINNLYNIGSTALTNAQISVDNASNNIANADTQGYQRTEVVYETGDSITINGLLIGTGADIQGIQSQMDKFVEAQYLETSADLTRQSASLAYLDQMDSLFNQTDGGLNDTMDAYWSAWNALSTDPDSLAAREALLGESGNLVYALNSTSEQLDGMEDAINAEAQDQINEANRLIEQIATANAGIAAYPENNQLKSDRNQMIRELDALIGIDVIENSSGQIKILTGEGHMLVDGTETHNLVYGMPRAIESLTRDSFYDGELQYSGESSEEILLEFTSNGADGVAEFKVSLDGGKTWEEDENGDTMLYTAGDENTSVEIAGVEIWFEGGTADHEVGDRYNLIPKTGLYWEGGDGTLKNITPLTDASGQDMSGRVSGGSLAGLFTTRDDNVIPTRDSLDDLSEAIIWEVNSAHSQGAGLEHHTGLTGSYSIEDSTVFLSNSGLNYADNIQAGDMELITYDANGAVSTSAIISIDPATDSLDDVIADINTAFAGELTASVNADGQLQLSATMGMSFETTGDSSNFMAALGVNTFFTGTNAGNIAIDSYVNEDISHINSSTVGSDAMVASGNNDVATLISALSGETVSIGSQQTSLNSYLSGLVSDVGSAAYSTELKQTYAQASAQYYYDQQAATSEVNVDEELIALTKHQQAYQAAAEIISVTRTMMDTLLEMV
jgi:flagellar hook-associated protein 1 FlgK